MKKVLTEKKILYFLSSTWWTRLILYAVLVLSFIALFEQIGVYLPFDIKIYFSISKYMFAVLVPFLIIKFIIDYYKFTFDFKLDILYYVKDIFKSIAYYIPVALIFFLFYYIYSSKIEYNKLFDLDIHFYFLTLSIFADACFEEIIFRGMIFASLKERFSVMNSVIVSSLIFSLVHFFNPEIGLTAFINIFLAGIVFSLMHYQTRSLILPVSFHFIWNLGQQVLLASPISGYNYNINMLNIDITTDSAFQNLLFGNDFGIESGLITSSLLLLLIVFNLRYSSSSPYLCSKHFQRLYRLAEMKDQHLDPKNKLHI